MDGSDPATDWQGVHSFDESPNVVNPPNGWMQNTNNWPYSAAGADSPKETALSRATWIAAGENPRGMHAHPRARGQEGLHARLAARRRVRQLLPEFERADPARWSRPTTQLPAAEPAEGEAGGAGRRCCATGTIAGRRTRSPTSLAVFWGEELWRRVAARGREGGHRRVRLHARRRPRRQNARGARRGVGPAGRGLRHLAHAVGRDQPLPAPHRRHRAAVRRRRRRAFPVPLHLGALGIAGLVRRRAVQRAPRRWYGTSGNSFVAVVEFGETACGPGRSRPAARAAIRRRSTSTIRRSATPRATCATCTSTAISSKGHTERTYRPGQ